MVDVGHGIPNVFQDVLLRCPYLSKVELETGLVGNVPFVSFDLCSLNEFIKVMVRV